MRKVYLQPIEYGDLRFHGLSYSGRHELRNKRGDSVFFIEPKVRRSVLYGISFVDYQCNRGDRVFGGEESYEVWKGTRQRANDL